MKEFESFLGSSHEPPHELRDNILSQIQKRLNPSVPITVLKLFAFNLVGSVSTLALCPQYGLSLAGATGFMRYLMDVHPALCFFVCGLMWMLGGQLLVNLFLSWDEQRVLSRYHWGTGFAFILFSVLGFACLGSLTLDGWLLAWGLGAIVVSSAFSFRIRAKMKRVEWAAQRAVGSGG